MPQIVFPCSSIAFSEHYFFTYEKLIFIYLTWCQCRYVCCCSINAISNFSSLILLFIVVWTLYTDSSRFLGKRNGLPDGRVVSMTKNEYIFCKDSWIPQNQYQMNGQWKFVEALAFLEFSWWRSVWCIICIIIYINQSCWSFLLIHCPLFSWTFVTTLLLSYCYSGISCSLKFDF